jgi:sulfatase maturation enzyme AslB (radical SAM superfamily)
MIRHGEAPFLECSSKGDKRFSAFYARLPILGNKSIEEIYQAAKVFEDGSTGLSIKEAKGRKAINQEELAERYSSLWNLYIMTNMHLLDVLEKASGLSDIFGQPGHVCQATSMVSWNPMNWIW